MKAERVTDSVVYHGEGPVWWPALGALRFVDMLAGDVMTLHPSGHLDRTPTGSAVGAVLRPRRGGGAVLALEDRVALSDSEDLSDLRPADPVFTDPGMRFNEGGCDPHGRFYCGTMAYQKTPGAARLYRVGSADGTGTEPVVVLLTGLTISNGLDWSPDGSLAYYNDTPTQQVTVFDYDLDGLTGARVFAAVPQEQGHPDGLCVDAEGGVWVALNGGGRVHRYDPDGALTEVVEVAARQTTACTFGGPDLDLLYVTTSREGLEPGQDPTAGSVYAVRPGVRGMPARPFAG